MSCRRSLHGQVPDHAYLCAARGCKYIGVGNQSLSSGTLTAPGRDAIAYVTPRTTANAARTIRCDFDCMDVLLVFWGLLTAVYFAAATTATAPLAAFSIRAATACGCDT